MKLKTSLIATALLSLAGIAAAAPITPTFTMFGALPGATFGGSGIPNTAVAISYAGNNAQNAGQLTLGLTAHQRCAGPNLASAGGVFSATPGASTAGATCALPGPSPTLASWNFAYFIAGEDVGELSFTIFYDFDAAIGNDESTHGRIDFLGSNLTAATSQGSQNLGFGFLGTSNSMLGITAPGVAFNPNAAGQYSFALVAYLGNEEYARSAIVVNVEGGNTVPVPGTLALAGLALLGAAGISRRRRA